MTKEQRRSKREADRLLDPARTGRNLYRRIYETGAGDLLNLIELGAARGFMHLCRTLPEFARNSLAELLKEAAFQLLSRQRQICYGNLTIAKGAVWDTDRIRSFTKQIFGYWSHAIVDFARLRLKMNRKNWQQFISCEELRTLDRILETHNGAILAGPHLGNWEFSTQALVLKGYSVTSVARRRKSSSLLDRDLLSWRTKWGQRILYEDESPREILRRLQNGELIGMVADQYAGRDGVFTDFFGAPTSHHQGPAVLAVRADVPILPGYCYWNEKENTYQVVVGAPLFPDGNLSRKDRVRKLISGLFQQFEGMIRSHPRQWLWFHRKWREKWLPDELLDLLESAPYLSAG